MNGASAALMISDIPFPAPVGAVRIGQDSEGNFVVNPDEEWLLESPLDLVVAGTEEAILMVEAGASEITEAEILDALDIAHAEIKQLCEAQRELRKQAGKDKIEHTAPQVDESLSSELKERFGPRSTRPPRCVDKLERQDATKRVEEEVARGTRPATPTTCRAPRGGAARVRQAREGHHPQADRGRQEAPRRPRRRRDPRHLDRGRRRPAHARLGDLHPRPDAGVLGGRARHHA